MNKWFAVADRDACDLEDDVWTISRDANVTGWNTDSGHNGYGLKFEDAEEIIRTLNSANALRKENERLRATLVKIAAYEAKEDWNGLARTMRDIARVSLEGKNNA